MSNYENWKAMYLLAIALGDESMMKRAAFQISSFIMVDCDGYVDQKPLQECLVNWQGTQYILSKPIDDFIGELPELYNYINSYIEEH